MDHKGETGTYNVHLYYQESDGHLQGVAAKQVTLPKKTAGAKTIPAQGSYVFQNTIEVKNEARMSAPTEFTLDAGYQVRYDKALYADGHQWISYLSYGSLRRYVLID
ncbi:cell wall associated protein [Streptococcus infantarius subsp. infantarius]|nr:cell wall associated protein [Streptococcus infantarius subsp. infantarius]